MQVKQVQRNSIAAWSPASHQPILLAAGTSAHQLDATFSTSSTLELFEVNLANPSKELQPLATMETPERFCRLVWGSHGSGDDLPWGVLVGGTANGKLVVYNPESLATAGGLAAEVLNRSAHTGAVNALDMNPFQKNLLCSGGGDSEIFIWDLANTSAQMTPGAKSLPAEDVLGVAWNRQVPHILGSVFASRCTVWDLKKSEPIIKLTDGMCRMRLKLISWHPRVATQLCLASDDDQTPLVQLWDLRFATSPVQQLDAHTKGVLSMAWSPFDPDYLLTTARDSCLLCWDPNSNAPGGEVVLKATLPNRWIFDAAWSPKQPSLLCASSMDGQMSVLNILGGSDHGEPAPAAAREPAGGPSSAAAADPFAQVHQPTVPAQVWYHPCKAPKWLRPRCGARFGFGGRLVSFGGEAASVSIGQVVTEPELVRRAADLELALGTGADIAGHCKARASSAKSEPERRLWQFLETNFTADPRSQFLKLLGFDVEEAEVAEEAAAEPTGDSAAGHDEPAAADADEFNAIAEEAKPLGLAAATDTATAEDADLTRALISGRIEAAVDLCLEKDRLAEAAILAVAGGAELYERTQARLFLRLNSDTGRLIRAVVTHACPYVIQHSGNEDWRQALAFALTYAGSEEFADLAEQIGRRLEAAGKREDAALCYVCAGSVPRLAACLMPQDPRPLQLQDVVEKAEILRLAVSDSSSPGGGAGGGDLGALTAHLGSYAEQLANQGELRAALRYLQPPAGSGNVERAHRLYQALGCPTDLPAPPNPFATSVTRGTAQSHLPFLVGPSVVNGVRQTGASQQQLPSKPQPAAANPYAAALVKAPSAAAAAAAQPQSMYNPAYHQAQAQAQDPYSRVQAPSLYPAYAQQPVVAPPPPATQPQQPPAVYNPQQQQQQQQQYSQQYNQQYSQQQASTMYQPPQVSMYSAMPPPQPMPGYPQPHHQQQQAQLQSVPPPPSASGPFKPRDTSTNAGAGPGWNDPPFVKEKKPADSVASSAAAPTNLYNPAAYVAQHPPGLPPPPPLNPLTAPPPLNNMPMMQQQQPPSSPHDKVGRRSRNASVCSDKGTGGTAAADAASAAGGGSASAPLPDQFAHFPGVLGEAVAACRQRSSVTPKKRQVAIKMDDVDKKLAALYELLGQNKLSPLVMEGLTAVVSNLQQHSLQDALAWVNHVIQSSNPAEIRTFMPGLKVLVQTAIELA